MIAHGWNNHEDGHYGAVSPADLIRLRRLLPELGPNAGAVIEYLIAHLDLGHKVEISAKVVYIDSPPDDPAQLEMGLEYERLAAPWNGWEVPIVTEEQFRDFITRWKHNDPNGTWGRVSVEQDADGEVTLVHHRSDVPDDDTDEDDVFHTVGVNDKGDLLFQIEGLVFYKKEGIS